MAQPPATEQPSPAATPGTIPSSGSSLSAMASAATGTPGFRWLGANATFVHSTQTVQAPPWGGLGALALNFAASTPGLSVGNVTIYLDPFTAAISLAFAHESGYVEVPMPVPAAPSLSGLNVWGQFVWIDATSPTLYGASHAAHVML